MKKKHKTSLKFEDYGILIIYSIAFLSLLTAVLFAEKGYHWIILFPIGVFIIYDIWFSFCRKDRWLSSGRSYKETIASINSASLYTSYFIAFIAISFSILLETGKDHFVWEVINDPWLKVYAFLILSLSGIILLFIPIPYKKKAKHAKEPSRALKNCFFTVLLLEKITIILIIYLFIMIIREAMN